MNTNETIAVVALIVAVVMIVALRKFKKRVIIIIEKYKITILFDNYDEPANNPAPSLKPSTNEVQRTSPWLIRHWRAVMALPAMLLIMVAPVWWWAQQPDGLRSHFTRPLSQTADAFIEIFRKSIHPKNGQATLDELAHMIEDLAAKLNRSFRGDEIWIVDHYWQYWNTAKLQKYLNLNKLFVANGGKIHRMFVLSKEELQNPEVQAMLQTQCQIGGFGEDEAGNGFELWRADPETIKAQQEYQTLARQFDKLHGSDESFENFDVVRFKDSVYYSSDFSADHRVLGSSTWIFDKGQVENIDLRPLFQKHIAERISCDGRTSQGGQQQVSVAAPPHFSNPI